MLQGAILVGGVFAAIFFGTYLLQLLIVLVAVAWAVLRGAFALLCLLLWCVLWCFNRPLALRLWKQHVPTPGVNL